MTVGRTYSRSALLCCWIRPSASYMQPAGTLDNELSLMILILFDAGAILSAIDTIQIVLVGPFVLNRDDHITRSALYLDTGSSGFKACRRSILNVLICQLTDIGIDMNGIQRQVCSFRRIDD